MANVFRFVNTSSTAGGDGTTNATSGANRAYATLSEWESNEQTNLVTDGDIHICTFEGSETGNVTIAGWTTGVNNYIKITVAEANRHTGIVGTGNANVTNTTNGSHVFTISESYTWIDNVIIRANSTGGSDEGIRITSGVFNVLITNDIIYNTNNTSDKDGIYTGNWAASYSVSNTVVYGFTRVGIHLQNYSGSGSQTANIDYCTLYNNGTGDFDEGNIASRDFSSGGNTLNIYNTVCMDGTVDFQTGGTASTWNGSNNACSDTSLTARGLTTNALESLTASSQFVDLTGGSEDFHILNTSSDIYASGLDRVGSEPDSRQDFSLDYEGDTRSTTSPAPDMGADEFVTASTGVTVNSVLGTLTLTGGTSSIINGVSVSSVLGSLSLTGGTSSILISKTVSSVLGTLTLTGGTSSIVTGSVFASSIGTLTLTGGTSSILTGVVVNSALGTLDITGGTSIISLPSAGDVTVNSVSGSLALAGGTSSISTGLVFHSTLGSLTLTGGTSTISLPSAGDVTVNSILGSVSLTGGTSSIINSASFISTIGSAVLTGGTSSISITTPGAGISETDFHRFLDSYTNKDDWKGGRLASSFYGASNGFDELNVLTIKQLEKVVEGLLAKIELISNSTCNQLSNNITEVSIELQNSLIQSSELFNSGNVNITTSLEESLKQNLLIQDNIKSLTANLDINKDIGTITDIVEGRVSTDTGLIINEVIQYIEKRLLHINVDINSNIHGLETTTIQGNKLSQSERKQIIDSLSKMFKSNIKKSIPTDKKFNSFLSKL